MFGHYYQPHDKDKLKGLSLMDAYTVAGQKRFIGNVTIKTDFLTPNTLVGFENHSGLTYLEGDTKPIGITVVGNGNNSKDYKEKMKQRLNVQSSIYSALSRSYSHNNKIVNHFYSKDKHVPIWGIFEIITLGTFADLIKSLEHNARLKIDKEMKLNIAFDTDARFPEKIMYLLKALRNSVAHNDVVFDVRFKDGKIDSTLCKYIENEIGCTNVDFSTITDYILIITLLLKKYGISKIELNRFVNEFENIIEDFRTNIPFNIYSQVIHTDTKAKLTELRKYIKK